MIHKIRQKCAICDNTKLDTILQYGDVPLAGYFPDKNDLDKEELFGLNILFCPTCKLVQTDSIVDSDKLFKDYRYMSSIGLSGHFTNVAKLYLDRFGLTKDDRIIEIGSNDGVLLRPLKKLGLNATGFDPASNIAKIARDDGLDVIDDYFSHENAQKYLDKNSIDLFSCNNCFAHIDDIKSIVRGIKYALKEDGHFVLEVSYLKDLIEKLQYDNIYHEHLYYYSLNALNNLFNEFDMTIVDFDFIPIHSGSIRVIVKNGVREQSSKIEILLHNEKQVGMTSYDWFKNFSTKVYNHVEMIKNKIAELKSQGYSIAGYGASGRANMTCNICDLNNEDIDFIVDESPERCGRFIAGKQIPIVSPEELNNKDVDYIVIFAWNFKDMIMNKLKGKEYKFITFFPSLKVE